ncbi:MAG: hypothetical protein JXP34_02245 [Planctomycetes bacterium]|nr:hypothetical protein [Planctomycetota bacterium]
MMRTSSVVAIAFLAALALGGPALAQSHFLRGDTNSDMRLDIADAVFELNYIFGGEEPKCIDSADVNDNGQLDIADPIYLLTYLFQDGAPPAEPFLTFEADPTPDDLTCKPEIVELTGDITADRTLTNDKTYLLKSGVFIRDGATLTIEGGTTVLGDSATEGLLVVDRGGRLVAVGTATHPVVFTSDKPVGSRGRGDWGGLIFLGRGICNFPGNEGEAEGLSGEKFGGGASPIEDDDCGRLSYVRVEFGGTEISPDNEVNAISVFAVGRSTQLDHIQTKFNLDDGVEWFGGNCDLKYGICTCIGDDNYDFSFGWVGKGQFWVCQQIHDAGDRGFEVDNSESEYGARPLTNPLISNFTLIGAPAPEGGTTKSDAGLMLRHGAGSRIYNGIVQGFQDAGLDIDTAITAENIDTGELVVDYCIFAQNKEAYETGDNKAGDPEDESTFAYTTLEFATVVNTHNVVTEDSVVEDPYNLTHPNFRGLAEKLPAPKDPTSMDSWFEPAPYVGAVPPAGMGEDWTREPWVSYWQD